MGLCRHQCISTCLPLWTLYASDRMLQRHGSNRGQGPAPKDTGGRVAGTARVRTLLSSAVTKRS